MKARGRSRFPGQAGSASILMVLILMIGITTALGLATLGRATGNSMRVQATADAAAMSAADLLAERLRHIGRLQEFAQTSLDAGDPEAAKKAVAAAWKIAQGTPKSVENEAKLVAIQNGAKMVTVHFPDDWTVEVPSEEQPGLTWVGLAPEKRVSVEIVQSTPDGDRVATSAAWVEAPAEGAVLCDDWKGRRVPYVPSPKPK